MNLKISLHAQYRLMERGIDLDYIKKAIRNPDVKEDIFEGRARVRKHLTEVGKSLEVVYFKEQFRDKREEYVIITAYYLD